MQALPSREMQSSTDPGFPRFPCASTLGDSLSRPRDLFPSSHLRNSHRHKHIHILELENNILSHTLTLGPPTLPFTHRILHSPNNGGRSWSWSVAASWTRAGSY